MWTGGLGTQGRGRERGQPCVALLCDMRFANSMSLSLRGNPLRESYCHPQFTDKETEAQRGRSSGPGHPAKR